MIDVVANHVGEIGHNFQRVNEITPFDSSDHYHTYCDITDWNNQQMVEECWLASLGDLKQENSWVK